MTLMKTRSLAALSLVLGIAAVGLGPGFAFAPTAAIAGVEDYSFQSMTVNYELDRGPNGESLLTTHERLEAVFPQTDQNQGIVRAIPLSMRGVSTNPTVLSVTDGDGTPRTFDATEEGEFLLVTIASDSFVYGLNVYEISYSQVNVVSEPNGPESAQELYLDVNGTGWLQPFGVVAANVTLSSEIATAPNGEAACYKGFDGASAPCDLLDNAGGSPDSPALTAEARDLAAGETLTFAMGLAPGTFVLPDRSFWAHPLALAFVIASFLLITLAVGSIVLRFTVWRDKSGRGIVVAQYEEPDGMFPLVAGDIVKRTRKGLPAELMALAVRGRIAVYDRNDGTNSNQGFDLELVSMEKLAPEESRMLQAVFGPDLSLGARVDTTQKSEPRAMRMRNLLLETARATESLGYRSRVSRGLRGLIFVGGLAISGATFLLGVSILSGGHGDVASILMTFVGTFVSTMTMLIALWRVRPLTESGALASEHLRGLKLFIGLAEASRLAFLQSPQGAQRSGNTDSGTASGAKASAKTSARQLLRIYERALPFAILFGLEKEWSKVLADVYDQASAEPSWYIGSEPFGAAAFSVGIGSFAAGASATWASSSSSSSSGGSSGGGSAGGGGGGGGGGGV